MFKKLKEKITEEVKISPQRFQQLTQSVSDRLQSSTQSDENFFSIGDDDASNSMDTSGFSNVSLTSPPDPRFRRTSTSSMASDVSFLPHYEANSMYHLQSDLDISASEVEDNASTSSQLGHLTKEQIYTAFQKSQVRYHKYRGRYSDLARHYKDLEREVVKMKAVLVETQDKAIRRVTELKEQCALEQKAKAHLEGALRDELDEKQFKIQSLQTKIELLQQPGNPPTSEPPGDSLETLTKYLNEARQEIESLNEKMQELKANSIIFQTKESDYKGKIANLERDLAQVAEREKENNLILAQNKMDLHNEILSKDAELSSLKHENETLKLTLNEYEVKGGTKLENLQNQNKNLIEKLEAAVQKCNGYESDLIKIEQMKIELEQLTSTNQELRQQLKTAEEGLVQVRDEAKHSLLSLETKIRDKIAGEFREKEEALKGEFVEKFKQISTSAESFQQLQLDLLAKEEAIQRLTDANDKIRLELSEKVDKYDELERNHLELIDDGMTVRNQLTQMEKQLAISENELENLQRRNQQHETNLKLMEAEVADYRQLEEENVKLTQLKDALEERVKIFEEKDRAIDLENTESKLLAMKLQQLEAEKTNLLEDFEKERGVLEELLRNNSNLKQSEERADNLEGELRELRDVIATSKHLTGVQEGEIEQLNRLKTQLEANVRELEERVRIFEEKDQAIDLENTQSRLLEMKVQKLEEEKRKILEDLEKQRIVFEETLHDNTQLKTSRERCLVLEGTNEELRKDLQNCQQQIEVCRREFNELAAVKLALEQSVRVLEERVRIFEEKDQAIELETTESRLLEMQVERLEEEKRRILDDFEKERKVLEDLIHDNRELEASQRHVDRLEEEMKRCQTIIEENQGEILHLQDANDKLQGKLAEFESKIHIYQQKEKGLELKLADLKVMEVKMGELQKENSHLLDEINLWKRLNEEQKVTIDSKQVQIEELTSRMNENIEQVRRSEAKIGELEGDKARLMEHSDKFNQLESETAHIRQQIDQLQQTNDEIELRNRQISADNQYLSEENQNLTSELADVKLRHEQSLVQNNHLREQLEKQLSDLTSEKLLLQDEVAELKTAPVNHNQHDHPNKKLDNLAIVRQAEEIEQLHEKLTQYKSLDLTNRSSIEFYENELQKVRSQNEKLNRKLDETLVTLNHCAELSSSTEIEYLRNVLYNYMLGKEGLVLARVIAAVCKFDPQQTELVLAKEQQKQTLLGQLGIM